MTKKVFQIWQSPKVDFIKLGHIKQAELQTMNTVGGS